MQALRRVEQVLQPAHDSGIADDFAVRERIDALLRIGEVGVDLPVVDVGDDQQWRVVQGFAVFQQLPVGSVQVFVFAGRFVLDSEVVLQPDIGETMPALPGLHGRLELKSLPRGRLAIASWRLVRD